MRGMAFWVLCLLTAMVGTASATPVAKKGKAAPAEPMVAILPVASDRLLDAAMAKAINDAIAEAAKGVTQTHVLAGKDLARAAKAPKPGARCGGKPKCLTMLGKKVKATEVVFCEASQVEGGVKLLFQAVDVRSSEVTRGVEVMVAAGEAAPDLVRAHFAEILGLSLPSTDETPGSAASGPAVATTGGETASEEFAFDLGDNTTSTTPEPPAAPTPPAQPPAELVENVPALAPPPPTRPEPATTAARTTVTPATPGRSAFLPVGVTLSAIGVAALGGGTYFGMRAKSLRSHISPDIAQTKARQRMEDANSAAGRATILLIGGGICAGLGVVAVLVDALLLGSSEHAMTVETASGGATVGLSF